MNEFELYEFNEANFCLRIHNLLTELDGLENSERRCEA